MELRQNYDVLRGLDAEVVAIAQEEADPAALASTRRFVENRFPLVADPDRASWRIFARYGVYVVDKKGVLRSFVAGTKDARPRLDLVVRALAAVAGRDAPPLRYDAGRIRVARQPGPHPRVDKAEDAVGARFLWSHPKIAPGQWFRLALVPRVAPGYHVYGFGETEMTPFSVEVDLPEGIRLAAPIEYPPPEIVEDPALGAKLRIYRGDIPLTAINFVAADSLGPGRVVVRVKLRFQACDESACFPPATKTLELPLDVVAAGSRRVPGVARWWNW